MLLFASHTHIFVFLFDYVAPTSSSNISDTLEIDQTEYMYGYA